MVSKLLKLALLASAVSTAAVFPASAQDFLGSDRMAQPSAPESNPLAGVTNKDVPPVIRTFMARGVTFTSLGNEGGLRAYLGQTQTGETQTFYVSPDGEFMVAGILFRSDGVNVTGVQIGEMQRRFEEAQKIAAAGAAAAPVPMPSGSEAEAEPAGDAGDPAPAPLPAGSENPPASPTVPAADPALTSPIAASPAPATTPPAVTVNRADAWATTKQAAEFVDVMDRTNWFRVGVEKAPHLWMIVDPSCPYCHAAWERLKPLVLEGKVQLRIVMIGVLEGSGPKAISILARDNPGQAWLAGEGSVDNFTVAPAPAEGTPAHTAGLAYSENNLRMARELLDKGYKMTGTPFLGYVGKDGKVYEASGAPEDLDAFISAL